MSETTDDLRKSLGLGQAGSAYYIAIGGAFHDEYLARQNAERYLKAIDDTVADLQQRLQAALDDAASWKEAALNGDRLVHAAEADNERLRERLVDAEMTLGEKAELILLRADNESLRGLKVEEVAQQLKDAGLLPDGFNELMKLTVTATKFWEEQAAALRNEVDALRGELDNWCTTVAPLTTIMGAQAHWRTTAEAMEKERNDAFAELAALKGKAERYEAALATIEGLTSLHLSVTPRLDTLNRFARDALTPAPSQEPTA